MRSEEARAADAARSRRRYEKRRGIRHREHVCPHLYELHLLRGYSTRQLARLAGVSRTSIWRLERLGRCRAGTVLRLAAALGVRPETLIGGISPRE